MKKTIIKNINMKFIQPKKDICCEDVLKCVFDLNKLDIKIYKILKKNREVRADSIAKKIGKDRSTIYRSLQKLTCCGICLKKTKKIDSGGYYHVYITNDIDFTKKKLEKCIDDWYYQMKETLKHFEEIEKI